MADVNVNDLIAAYVTVRKRMHAQSTRGIESAEGRERWRSEAVAALDDLVATVRNDTLREAEREIRATGARRGSRMSFDGGISDAAATVKRMRKEATP